LFQLALAKPVGDREEFLRLMCREDTALLDEVLTLLRAEQEAGHFLEEPLVEIPRCFDAFEREERTHTADADPQSIMCYWLPASIMKDGVAVSGGTDINSMDAQFAASVYPRNGWQRFELAEEGSASSTSMIAVVSRIPGSTEMWWIGGDGTVQDAFWYEGAQWQRFELAPAGSASRSNSGIRAVSRVQNSTEMWWIGSDGSVQDAYWYEGRQWQWFELAPAGSASTTAGIGAVSRVPIAWRCGGSARTARFKMHFGMSESLGGVSAEIAKLF
jgi:hypothetical protein